MRTLFLNLKSLTGSFPAMTGVDRLSLEVDGTRDIAGLAGGILVDLTESAFSAELGADGAAATGGLGASCVLLLRLMIAVSSFLNFSLSEYAVGGGEMNVKL
jgi:hypothetical protein